MEDMRHENGSFTSKEASISPGKSTDILDCLTYLVIAKAEYLAS